MKPLSEKICPLEEEKGGFCFDPYCYHYGFLKRIINE
jgi:hypothetical protein